jgi:hypothetical protein
MSNKEIKLEEWLFNVDSWNDSIEKNASLEFKLRNRGVWYRDEKRSEELGSEYFRCVINKLSTYCAVLNEEKVLVITTYWPYKKSDHKKLDRLEYVGSFSKLENLEL